MLKRALEWGLPYSKFSLGGVYSQFYGRKVRFTALRKAKISEHETNDIPPQMKILNTVNP